MGPLLDPALQLITDRLDHQDKVLDQILEQAKKTNGRVTVLEQDKAIREDRELTRQLRLTRRHGRVEWLLGSVCVLAGGAVGELLHLFGV